MSILVQINPFEFFWDLDGDPLDAGYIYIGQPNKDPQQYPVTVYYDEALTIPAPQPLRTVDGYISRNGSPAYLYINGNYSIRVLDKKMRQVYFVPDFQMIGNATAATINDLNNFKADFANTSDAAKGDALVGVKVSFSGSVGRTQHDKNNDIVFVEDFGAKGDGVTDDYAAFQAAINSGAREIRCRASSYLIKSTLNVTNFAQSGIPLKIVGKGIQLDHGSTSAGTILLCSQGNGSWMADFTGSQFIVLEDLYFLSYGATPPSFGLLYARSTVANFAQNNSLRRVMVVLTSVGGSSIALGNNCAEQFVCDECWFTADIPLVCTLANEQGFVSPYTTIANSIFSNTCHSYRQCTFQALTSTSMILTGLATATFDNCIVIPNGSVHPYAITMRSSVQGYQDCQNITFTGQIETFATAFRLEGQTRDLKIDCSLSSVSGPYVVAVGGTIHFNPDIRFNPLNAVPANVWQGTGATTVAGGAIAIPPNCTLIDTNFVLQGTEVDGGQGNLGITSIFNVNPQSSYHPRWRFSQFHGSTPWTPGGIPPTSAAVITFAVTNAALGDEVRAIWPYASQGGILQGSVDSAGTVRLVIYNLTGATITFGAGTFKVIVSRPAF